MSGRFFLSGTTPLFEGSAQPLSTFTFSLVGTSTAQDTYSDSGLASANTNPVVTDAYGYLGEVYLSRNRYKVVWKNAAGTTLKTWDSVDKDKIHTVGAGFPADPHPGQIHDNTSNGNRYEYKINSASWLLIGPTDSVGNTSSVTETLTGTETAKFVTPDSLAAIWQRGTAITPSGGTVSLPSTGGGVFNIAAGNFASISTAQGGRAVLFVFSGTSVITYDGTSMILPGGADITTEAGDCACFVNEAAADASGANWRCVWYQRDSATLTPVVNYGAAASDMETGTSTIKYVTPAVAQRHASAAKCWGSFDFAGNITSSYNLTSIADTGTGLVTVTIATDFSSATWAALVSADVSSAGAFLDRLTNYSAKAAGTIVLRVYDPSGTAQADADGVDFVGFGDQ